MCISVLSTSHPDYPFILISNRDEYINRPTLRANWWDPPNQQVLGGRDTQRAERGTWLGITKQGRIAVLTNFREEGVEVNKNKSRGAITNSYLCIPPESQETEEEYARRLLNETGIHDVGGFTLIFGKLRSPKIHQNTPTTSTSGGLSILSNKTSSPTSLPRIATTRHETHGLSNSHYGDKTWPKIVLGETLLSQTIQNSTKTQQSQPEFLESLFQILSLDTLPKTSDWNAYVRHMRDSILISPAKGELAERMAGYVPATSVSETAAYGTSKQTVILVDAKGKVTFVERTLFDQEGRVVGEDERDLRFEFEIEGWDGE
ncbi:uncharacterized protein MYCFIDRAFT_35667 [Pseudocercospora fijiensis CIRAD86]|uniref:DUF833-domain-containing protein n=1 Tax=Pseudocercospora fijiensis (strain CIRAD86) TaxID=383855 RepID=N1QA66_PSEFD|nr:uncharacterized protein MYCFIDRAFT_35667 [Pseudocercospora fijiensis CIRAD86]EME88656.1 hypothetical protein MYCFIDRAFT_35667 [Pseudocercospora fijiensis CIRAD86]